MIREDVHPLTTFLDPASIALIGVSGDPNRYNGRILKYLLKHGYAGRVYPVNPRYTEVQGLRCYPSVQDLPEAPDLALLLVGTERTVEALEACAARGVKNAIVFAAGFAESAVPESHRRQEALAAVVGALRDRMRVMGPNCNGFINYGKRIAAASSASLETEVLSAGHVGLVAQSAGIGMATAPTLARISGMGFRYIVSSGNEIDLEACDFIEYMLRDPDVRVIAAVVEGFRNGPRAVALAREAAGIGKPLVILKTGRTEAGARAAASHTAAISGSQRVFEAVCRQTGVISVRDVDELLVTARLLAVVPEWPEDVALGSVSMSGGFVTLMSDAAEESGLRYPPLAAGTRERLRSVLPPFMEPGNPVDLTAAAVGAWSTFGDTLRLLDADPGVTVLAPVLTVNDLIDEPCRQFLAVRKEVRKPMVVVWPSGLHAGDWYRTLWDAGIPVLESATGGFETLGRIQQWARARRRLVADAGAGAPALDLPAPSELRAGGGPSLGESATKRILARMGVPAPREARARSADEAAAAAEGVGYPVVLKTDAAGVLHKTEVGGVVVGLRSANEVRSAYERVVRSVAERLPGASSTAVLVQAMVEDGIEVIVGTTRDPQFGPVVMFGLGGIFTEVLEDVSLRLAPVSRVEADAMIREVRGFKVLDGYRGARGDLPALADVIVRVSALAAGLNDVVDQVEINPLFVLPEGRGVLAGDGLLVLRSPIDNVAR